MVGGDDYDDAAVQPRDPGPAPARLVDQAVHPGRGDPPGDLPRLDLGVAEDDLRRARLERGLHGQQLRGRVLGHHHARARDDVLRQLRVRPGRHQGRDQERRAARRADGHPHAGLQELRDDARRPQAGRDAAGHGARLRDVRQRRQPRLRHAQPGRREPPPPDRPRAGRHPRDQPPRRRQVEAGQAAQRGAGGQPDAEAPGPRPERHRAGRLDPPGRRRVRHRHPRAGARRDRRRQDGHDRGLRRRVVRGLDAASTRWPCGSATPTRSRRWRPSSRATRWRAAPSRRRSSSRSSRPWPSREEDEGAGERR